MFHLPKCANLPEALVIYTTMPTLGDTSNGGLPLCARLCKAHGQLWAHKVVEKWAWRHSGFAVGNVSDMDP